MKIINFNIYVTGHFVNDIVMPVQLRIGNKKRKRRGKISSTVIENPNEIRNVIPMFRKHASSEPLRIEEMINHQGGNRNLGSLY